MNKQIKGLVRNLGKSLAGNSKKRSRGPGRARGGVQSTKRSYPQLFNGRALPAAYASHVRPRFNMVSRGREEIVVSGADLVYPLPTTVSSGDTDLFSIIPCNPAYWTGTRIAQFAPAYMNYRPIKITFSYIPYVAVTQPGTVIMGTLWNGSAASSDIQQTLFTSNGGCMTQCYVPADTEVKLGANLQQNLFTLCGAIEPDTSPFIFVAAARGTSGVIPGYFYVTYSFSFKNPIGQAWDYQRSNAVRFGEATFNLPNRSLVLLSSAAGYGPGTVMDVEQIDGKITVLYKGSSVNLPEDAIVQIFENGQVSRTDEQPEKPSNSFTPVRYAFLDADGNELRSAALTTYQTALGAVTTNHRILYYNPTALFTLDGEEYHGFKFSSGGLTAGVNYVSYEDSAAYVRLEDAGGEFVLLAMQNETNYYPVMLIMECGGR